MSANSIAKSDAERYAQQTLLYFLLPDREGARGRRVAERGKVLDRRWSVSNLPLALVPEGRRRRSVTSPTLFSSVRDIYDVRGRHLFRDFLSILRDGSRLRVRTVTDQRLRSPVWSLGIGADWDLDLALEKAVQVASRRRLRPVEGKKRLVCYSYPKLGLLCRGAAGKKAVIDLGHLTPVEATDLEGAVSPERLAIWSPLDALSSVHSPANREAWAMSIAPLAPGTLALDPVALGRQVEGARSEVQQDVLAGMTLHGQETPYYCAVATAQMILRYHGIDRTQSQIAAAMNTTASGTSNEDQVAGYRTLSRSQSLEVSLDLTPSFAEAKAEISQHRCPLKSGVTGHARACAGWKTAPGASGTVKQWLYIYDPWPPDQGEIYWEDWSSVLHTNFICVNKP